MYNVSPSDISDMKNFILWILVAVAINIAGRVCITLAVGEDAKILGVKNRTLWMVLSFLAPIFALIYLIVRKTLEKNVMRMCLNCGATMPPNTKICFNCSSTVLEDYKLVDEQKHKNNRSLYIGFGVALLVIAMFVSSYASTNLSKTFIKRYGNNQNPGGYSDFFNEFPNGGDNGNSNSDGNSGDKEDDDLFDDFNNFGNND